jgi:hypothetical protein
MKTDIINNIIWNAGSIENPISLKQDDETRKEYIERIYEEANDLFMDSVEELGLNTLDDEDVAPYDNIKNEVIDEIAEYLIGKK